MYVCNFRPASLLIVVLGPEQWMMGERPGSAA